MPARLDEAAPEPLLFRRGDRRLLSDWVGWGFFNRLTKNPKVVVFPVWVLKGLFLNWFFLFFFCFNLSWFLIRRGSVFDRKFVVFSLIDGWRRLCGSCWFVGCILSPLLVEQQISFLRQCFFVASFADETIVAFEPLPALGLTVAVVVTAIRGETAVHTHSVQIVLFIGQFLQLIWLVHSRVHVPLQVERTWVLHESSYLSPKNVESFHSGHQDLGRFHNTQGFRRVLLFLANGTQVFVILRELVDWEKLFERLAEVALISLCRQRDIERKSFVKRVWLVVARLTFDLRTQGSAKNFEQGRLRLVFDHV